MNVTLCNPLARVPLSLIIDDSCPVINKAWYWIKERHDWRLRCVPDTEPYGWEQLYDRLGEMPQTVSASFAEEWGSWCAEQGIKGKFSMVPFPAGVGRIDTGFDGFPARDLDDWIRVTEEVIHPDFDITPEMLTHTRVVDLKTWKLTEEWEQVEWYDPPADRLTEYVTAAMQLLKNAGIRAEGVTSPGAFGKKKEELYSRAVLEASRSVFGNDRPFYFLWLKHDVLPETTVKHAAPDEGVAVASIFACAGDWFGGTGWGTADPDLFITPDLQAGRVAEVLAAERPCVLVGHWPCFHANGQVGFRVLKEVKKRLDAYDPDRTRTIWMKNSAIGHYAMAQKFTGITVEPAAAGVTRITLDTRYPAADFTFSVDAACRRVQLNGTDLKPASGRKTFKAGTFLAEDRRTLVALDLNEGETILEIDQA